MVGRTAHHVRDHPPVDPVVAVHQEFEIFFVQEIEARFVLVGHRSGTGLHGKSSAGLDGMNAAGPSPANAMGAYAGNLMPGELGIFPKLLALAGETVK
jgi:hypothetical protein